MNGGTCAVVLVPEVIGLPGVSIRSVIALDPKDVIAYNNRGFAYSSKGDYGRAIADYLKFERPQTTNRAVFVRHIAPRDQPIGPDLVRKAIRQAYARAGLPYTRSHLLRHTMASRLLAGGSSLKEVADVLRHRSLNTALIYAKLDSRNLAGVALAWPGCAA
jgi:integrase